MVTIFQPSNVISFDRYSGNVNNTGTQKIAQVSESLAFKPSYDQGQRYFVTAQNVNGTLAFDSDKSAVTLSIPTGASDIIDRQTEEAFTYFASNTQRTTLAVHVDIQDGAIVELGPFTDEDGAFFRFESSGGVQSLSVVRRSSWTGTPVDTVIPQASWNIDPLDGTGPSGVTLDLTKVQMLQIEYSWYGGGIIMFGIVENRQITHFHAEAAGNRLTEFIFGEPDLPYRQIIRNTVATAGTSTLTVGGLFVGQDGDIGKRKGIRRCIYTGQVGVTNGSSTMLLAIRPKQIFQGLPNKTTLNLDDFWVATTADCLVKVHRNPTLSGAVWTDVDTTESSIEFDTTSTISTPGIIEYAHGITSNKGADFFSNINSADSIVRWSDGSGATIIALELDAYSNGNVSVGVNWFEFY